jgi:hypothetical protein
MSSSYTALLSYIESLNFLIHNMELVWDLINLTIAYSVLLQVENSCRDVAIRTYFTTPTHGTHVRTHVCARVRVCVCMCGMRTCSGINFMNVCSKHCNADPRLAADTSM